MLRLPAKAPVASQFAKGGNALRVRGLVVARADGPKVTREFRETADGGFEDVTASSSKAAPANPPGALYADEVAQAPRKKGNMSKEMKARLRAEYTGFGGAENAAMSQNYFLYMIFIIGGLAVASKLTGAL